MNSSALARPVPPTQKKKLSSSSSTSFLASASRRENLSSRESEIKLQAEAGLRPKGSKESQRNEQLQQNSISTSSQLLKRPKRATKPELSIQDQQLNAKVVRSMNQKITFLKNPRFREVHPPIQFTDLGTKQGKDVVVNSLECKMKAYPQELIFWDFDIDKVYELDLLITNTETLSRRIKILPPQLLCFSLKEVKYPTPLPHTDKEEFHVQGQELGMLAAGMSVSLKIQFQAHNFQEQLDSITVISEVNSFKIPISARRNAPELFGLPSELDCKSCWIGDRCMEVFKLNNRGGDCGFRLFCLNEDEESPESDHEILKIGRFEIYPREFYIQSGDTQELVVTYSPEGEGISTKQVVLACDNRTHKVLNLRGGANMAEVNIIGIDSLSIDDFQDRDQANYNTDSSHLEAGQHNQLEHVFFEGAVPGIRKSRILKLKNQGDVKLSYHWDLYNKHQKIEINRDSNSGNTAAALSIFKQDEFCFSIKPSSGSFKPQEIVEFEVSFLCKGTDSVFEDLTLFLDGIPFESIRQISPFLKKYMRDKLAQPTLLPKDHLPGFIGSNSPNPSTPYLNLTLIGFTAFPQVRILPLPFHLFPNPLLINMVRTHSFTIKNDSLSPLKYEITLKSVTAPEVSLTVDHSTGSVPPGGEVLIETRFACSKVSEQRQTGVLLINFDMAHPLSYEVSGCFVGPSIKLHQSQIDFGLMKSLEKRTINLIIENTSAIVAHVSIRDINEKKKKQISSSVAQLGSMSTSRDESDTDRILENALDLMELMQIRCNLQILDGNVTIKPFSKVTVPIACTSGVEELFQSTIEVQADNSNQKLYLNVLASVQRVTVSLNRLNLDIPCLYADQLYTFKEDLSDPSAQFIQIQNLGNIDTEFTWEIPADPNFKVQFMPMKGIVKAKQVCNIEVKLTAYRGTILETIFVCQIKDMKYPLGFQVNTPIYGLTVSIEELSLKAESKAKTNPNEPSSEDQQLISLEESNMFNNFIMKSNVKNSQLLRSMKGSDIFKSFEAIQRLNKQSIGSAPSLESCNRVKADKLDFLGCIINQPKHTYLLLTNTSGIPTNFEVSSESYKPFKPRLSQIQSISHGENNSTVQSNTKKSRLSNKLKMDQSMTASVLLNADLEKTHNFNSRQGHELNAARKLDKEQRFHLQNDKGIAILCEPSSGFLGPHCSQIIKISVFNDISGKVNDNLIVNIEGLSQQKIPIIIDVQGSPVIVSPYQLGVSYKGEYPVYDLGSYMKSGMLVEREFKVSNTGPKTVKIVWSMVNLSTQANQAGVEFFKVIIADPVFGKGDVCSLNFESISPPEATTGPFHIEPKYKTKNALEFEMDGFGLFFLQRELIIGGREEKSFKVRFMDDEVSDFVAVLTAKPMILKKDGSEETDIKIDQLILGLQAHTLSPHLYIDKLKSQDGRTVLKLEKWSLFPNKKDRKEVCLVNKEFVTVKFDLEIQGPFSIDSVNSTSKTNILNSMISKQSKALTKTIKSFHDTTTQHHEALETTNQTGQLPLSMTYTLEQHTNMTLTILYDGYDVKDLSAWPMTYKNYNYGKLLIRYTNGDTQTIDLEGHLLRPLVVLNTSGQEGFEGPEIQDFGVVHINDTKFLTLFLSNTSKVPANWKIHHIKNPFKKFLGTATMTAEEKENHAITDDQDVFQFAVSEGQLLGPSIPVRSFPETLSLPTEITTTKNYEQMIMPEKIQVVFKPKKNVMYKSKYRISVEQGPTVDFLLKGIGTYDEEILRVS